MEVHIFYLSPLDFKLGHLLGHSDLMKIMAHFGRRHKMSDTSISSSLSLDISTKNGALNSGTKLGEILNCNRYVGSEVSNWKRRFQSGELNW